MANGPPTGEPPAGNPDAALRVAQDGADELAGMGIDPRLLGLDPAAPPPAPPPVVPPDPPTSPVPPPPELTRPARGIARPPGMVSVPVPPPSAVPLVPPGTPIGAPLPPPPPAPPPVAPEWTDSALNRPIGGGPPPLPPAAASLTTPVAPTAPGTGPPHSGTWRRVARAVTLGLVEPDAAAAVEYERHLVARARLRRPEPRTVAFLAGKGGVGTTTTAIGVAFTLAALRNDAVALVSARSGADSLGLRLLGHPGPAVPALASGDRPAEPLWVHQNLALVDSPPWFSPTGRGQLVTVLERLRGRHPLILVDVGNDLGEPAQAALAGADQVVLVTSTSQDAVAATEVALSRVHQANPSRLATVVVAVICLHRWQYRWVTRRLKALRLRTRSVPVGFDPWLAAGRRIDQARIRPTTLKSYLHIAGLAVEPGPPDEWFVQPGSPAGAAR
jgi:MinD-like ATPase involved in chromosome partitioning or flagellar assembly